MRTRTHAELVYHNRLAELGCIACYLDGVVNPIVSIHHTDGRTKKNCHMKVFPLCAGHHQDGTGNDKTLVAIHPYKARFEALYGSEEKLVELAADLLMSIDKYDTACRYVCENHLYRCHDGSRR